MPLLPGLQPIFGSLTSMAVPDDLPVPEMRAAMHEAIEASFSALSEAVDPVESEVDHRIPVEGGEITVRVYRPHLQSPAPCHVYLHGGGFFLGTLDQSDATCRALARDVACVVASVDYRLAPEHKYPTATEDAYVALVWVDEHADELGVDRARISVGGGSAGGNLAAVVSLMARDRSGPMPVFQVLEIPVTDFTRSDPLIFESEGITIDGEKKYAEYYLRSAADGSEPYASPLLASDLTGLPPALVMCAEYDPLSVEGMAYALRLRDAGVPVEAVCWEGQFHGSQGMAKLIPDEARRYHEKVVAALRAAFGAADNA